MGCGFYDVFYEGCGATTTCFYDAAACTPGTPFYDFYTGNTLAYPPVTQYSEAFTAGQTIGARAGLNAVVWSDTTRVSSPTSEDYLGGFAATKMVTMTLDGLPATDSDYTLSFDLITSSAATSPYAAVTVLGEGGAMTASKSFNAGTSGVGLPMYQMEYKFSYVETTMRVSFAIAAGSLASGATWGIDNVLLTSLTSNYKPVAEAKQLHIASDPISGGSNTIELRGHDNECTTLSYVVTKLPTEGQLFLCTCDSIWTTPITTVPATVPGPCHRLVYAPQANMPKASLGGLPFDTFEYQVVDASGIKSEPGTVDVYVSADGSTNTPVAGQAGFALAFDGTDDVVSISEGAERRQGVLARGAFPRRRRCRGNAVPQEGLVLARVDRGRIPRLLRDWRLEHRRRAHEHPVCGSLLAPRGVLVRLG